MSAVASPDAAPAPWRGGFTLLPLAWRAWLPTVALEDASAEQLAVLDESTPAARTSAYYLLLVHDTEALRERSRLFNRIMYAPKGLARAERELATVAVSRVNGCAYCASVHARRYAELARDAPTVQRLLAEGAGTPLDARRRAIVDFAVRLSATPAAATPADLAALRAAGLGDLEILDLIHAVAIFAWANRLMQTLGEPVAPAA